MSSRRESDAAHPHAGLYDYNEQIVSQQERLCFPSTLSGQVARLPGAGTETPSASDDGWPCVRLVIRLPTRDAQKATP